MNTKKVVSANYNDRESDLRWLIRDEDQPHGQAVAYKAVKATGVTFQESDQWETGFGCTVIASCETAEGSDESKQIETEGLRQLEFDGQFFLDKEKGNLVDTVDVLYLSPDGQIYAQVSVPEPVGVV